jgi:hypothetical protein
MFESSILSHQMNTTNKRIIADNRDILERKEMFALSLISNTKHSEEKNKTSN